MKSHRIVTVILAAFLSLSGAVWGADPPRDIKWYEVKEGKVHIHLYMFWSETCPRCAVAHPFVEALNKKYDWLHVTTYEITTKPENREWYRTMAETIGKQPGQVPAFFYCRQLEIGYDRDETTGAKLEKGLLYYQEALQKKQDEKAKSKDPSKTIRPFYDAPQPPPDDPLELDALPPPPDAERVNLPWWGSVKVDEVSLPALTVMLGGFDSFNPCAFFVLMILLGLMLHSGNRWKMLLVGGTFVFISGLVYFLFMAAWLNLFFLVGHLRIITLAAGIVAVVVAIINIKDYFWFKDGVSLSLSDSARSRLVQRMRGLMNKSGILPVMAGTAALAFAANLYELLCTSGLPLVYTRVLTLRQLTPLEYYGYLALYNVVYVLPLFLIVLVLTLTLSVHKITEYQGRVLKLLSGTMMLALGSILIFKPALLNHLLGAVFTLVGAVFAAAVIVLIHRLLTRPLPVKTV